MQDSVVNYPNIFPIGNCHWKYIHIDINFTLQKCPPNSENPRMRQCINHRHVQFEGGPFKWIYDPYYTQGLYILKVQVPQQGLRTLSICQTGQAVKRIAHRLVNAPKPARSVHSDMLDSDGFWRKFRERNIKKVKSPNFTSVAGNSHLLTNVRPTVLSFYPPQCSVLRVLKA